MLKHIIEKSLRKLGYHASTYTRDLEPLFHDIANRCRPYTMTPPERMYGLFKALEYIVRARIDGDIAECGVWRGGSCMAAALTLQQLGDTSRCLYLYDTYAGMMRPGQHDVDHNRTPAIRTWLRLKRSDRNAWCYASIDDVRENMFSISYPKDRMRFIKGDVIETIPREAPDRIALLRLDTDFYESTRHALLHLYPRLTRFGVLIIDDYGHWLGARKAVDEYFQENGITMLLHRLDYSARMGIKIH